MRRNRTLRLSDSELRLHEEAMGDVPWSEWARRALREAAELDLVEKRRIEQEKAEREALKERLGVA